MIMESVFNLNEDVKPGVSTPAWLAHTNDPTCEISLGNDIKETLSQVKQEETEARGLPAETCDSENDAKYDDDFSIKLELLHEELDIKTEILSDFEDCETTGPLEKSRLKWSSHQDGKIQTGEKPLIDYSYTEGQALEEATKTRTVEKPHVCTVCERLFTRKGNLKQHMRLHTHKKCFKCSICDHRTLQKSAFEEHMRIHSGERPFKCNICDYSNARMEHLEVHMRSHTGDKPFKCNVCEYRGTSKSHLLRHMKTHTGEKRFRCNVCEHRTTQLIYMETHMRTHSVEKPFQCKMCKYSTINKRLLQTHMKIHTPLLM